MFESPYFSTALVNNDFIYIIISTLTLVEAIAISAGVNSNPWSFLFAHAHKANNSVKPVLINEHQENIIKICKTKGSVIKAFKLLR